MILQSGPVTLPHFNSKSGLAIWRESVEAYSHLRSVSFTVQDGRRKAWVRISGRMAAQSERGFSWAYDGRYLRVHQGRRSRRARVPASEIPVKIGAALDPFLRTWSLHLNPVRSLGSAKMTGRLAGQVTVKGLVCDVVELKGTGLRLTILIRRKDHLMARTSSESLDRAGHRLSSADREYEYLSIGKSLPNSDFQVR